MRPPPTPPARALTATLFAALLAGLLAAPALAHQKRAVRTATASARPVADAVALDVMLWLRFAGERADAFRARFDVDRSGRFEPAEAALAGDSLAPEAIGGFFVRFDGAARPPKTAEAKARIADGDAIEVAVLLSWAPHPARAVELASRAGRDREGAPVIMARFAALPPLRLVSSRPASGGVAGPAPLLPGGDGLAVELRLDDPVPLPAEPPASPEETP